MTSGSSRMPARIFLFDSLDGTQLVLPGSFERARHKPVFGLDGVILASCPLGLVARPFSSQRPLPLELPTLFLQLPHRRDCDRNLIRGEGIEENALDERVDRQGPNFLTQRAGSLVAIDPATIDRIVAIRPGVAQTHAAAAAAADCDALQQRRASARRASVSRLIVVDVVCQSPLVGHELLPADITRVSGLQANRPVPDCHLDGSPTRSAFGIGSDPFADGRRHTPQHRPDSEEYCEPAHYRLPARRHRAATVRGSVGPATAIRSCAGSA